jgi:hypothetical protein
MEKINGFKTFREFIELVEGKKKKEIKRLKSAYLAGQEQAPRQIKNYGAITAPNSEARRLQVAAMMANSGGGAVRKAKEKREKEAEKAAKNILKQQEGFSYGSKSYQQELEKKKNEAQNQKNQERQQTSSDLYNERTRGRGIRSRSKGRDGWIKNGVFTPDEDG